MFTNYQSKKYRVTKFLSQISIFSYLLFVLTMYLLSILLCALMYCQGGYLHYSADSTVVANFFDCLYFSVITQTTIGYGDILPISYGRVIASFQALYGTIYLAIFVGLYLLKYIWTVDVVRVSKVIAFNPDERVFRVRIINLSAFDLHNISLGLWENSDKAAENYLSNKPLDLLYKNILSIASMSHWRIKTLPMEGDFINELFARIRKFYFQIDGKFIYSNYINTFKIDRNHIMCGNFADLKRAGQTIKDYKKYNWGNFDVINPVKQRAEKCANCEFCKACICTNKAELSDE